MGLLWDLMQESRMSNQDSRADTLESRVVYLERELNRTQTLLHKLIQTLEKKFDEDIDGDGKIGNS